MTSHIVVAVTTRGDHFARQVSIADADAMLDATKHVIDELCAHVQEHTKQHIARILVNNGGNTTANSEQTPVLTNICGKLTHPSEQNVYAPHVRPFIQSNNNDFGSSYCVYTTAANFYTGFEKVSTLFRGGGRKHEIQHAIDHIFGHAVASTVMHLGVCSSRLGHPVTAKNELIEEALGAKLRCKVTRCASGDECMFLHALELKEFDPGVLEQYGLQNVFKVKRRNKVAYVERVSVRVNLCRTGVLNCFVSIPGGVDWAADPQDSVLRLCQEIHTLVWKAS